MFASGNGVPPSSGVQLINNAGKFGGAGRDLLSFNAAGWPTGTPLARCACATWSRAPTRPPKLQAGLDETRRNGNLRGKPTLIVHGRADALLPSAIPRARMRRSTARSKAPPAKLRYLEVTNAQHFDSFVGLPTVLPGYDTRYVPLHVYLNRALDAMYEHLANGKALPASQVGAHRAARRCAGQRQSHYGANVPPLAMLPVAGNAIAITAGLIAIPD